MKRSVSADRGRPWPREGENQLVLGAVVPRAAGRRVVGPSQIEIRHDNHARPVTARCYGRGHQILNLEHYLDVLEKKPGAMAGSTPLQQWRQAGRWPECMDRIWQQLEQRHGKSAGTREMITLVRAGSVGGMGPAHRGRGRGVAAGGYGCGRGAAHFSYAGPAAAPAVRHGAGGRTGAIRAAHAGDGRIRSVADRHAGGIQ